MEWFALRALNRINAPAGNEALATKVDDRYGDARHFHEVVLHPDHC